MIYTSCEGSVPINDADHLRNHLYYLFFRIKGRPENAETGLNLFLEFEGGKTDTPKITRSFYNTDTKKACKRTQAIMPTQASTNARLRADVTYFAFIIPFGEILVSNFVRGGLSSEQAEVSIDASVLRFVKNGFPHQEVVEREVS